MRAKSDFEEALRAYGGLAENFFRRMKQKRKICPHINSKEFVRYYIRGRLIFASDYCPDCGEVYEIRR